MKNGMTMTYIVENKNNENKIQILGQRFLKNNKGKFKLYLAGSEIEESDIYNYTGNEDNIEIKLVENEKITDFSYLFHSCSFLFKFDCCWDFSNITNISSMFQGCKALSDLPDISKWNISNVKDMKCLFYECNSLKSIPDFSLWDTSNITDMSCLFAGCNSLLSLQDLSKWNTSIKKYS